LSSLECDSAAIREGLGGPAATLGKGNAKPGRCGHLPGFFGTLPVEIALSGLVSTYNPWVPRSSRGTTVEGAGG